MNKKKILHIINGLDDGGAESILTKLCCNSHGVSHVVVSLMNLGKYGELLQDAGIKVYCLNMGRKKGNLLNFFKIFGLIRDEKPYAVQTWMYHSDLLGGLAAKICGVRYVFWGVRHSKLTRKDSKRTTILVSSICAILSSWLPEKIVYCANKSKLSHVEIGYESSKSIVIPNGYDFSVFYPDVKLRQDIRQEFGIRSSQFLVGMVGRYTPEKDHQNLLKALCLVREKITDFHCLLVGFSVEPSNESLVQAINELKLDSCITLCGQRADIPAIMNAIDVHILSSNSEGFPNVLAEAMACGTPCVSTDAGDAKEIIGNKSCVCPPKQPLALAEQVIALHQEWNGAEASWIKRKEVSRLRIQANFGLGAMVEAFESVWLDTPELKK